MNLSKAVLSINVPKETGLLKKSTAKGHLSLIKEAWIFEAEKKIGSQLTSKTTSPFTITTDAENHALTATVLQFCTQKITNYTSNRIFDAQKAFPKSTLPKPHTRSLTLSLFEK